MKPCAKCKEEKPLDKFYVNKKTGRLRSYCKGCCYQDTKKFYATHPGYRAITRDNTRFGGQRNTVLARDNWSCVVCGMTDEEHREKWQRAITIDHIDGRGRYSEIQNNDLENLQTLCLSCHGKKDIQLRWAPRSY